jgi:hypothetical protein
MAAFIFWLMAIFVLEPIYMDYGVTLARRGAPADVVEEMAVCRDVAGDAFVSRIEDGAWWGVRSLVRVWIGTATPGDILADVVPNCAPAVTAAEIYLYPES